MPQLWWGSESPDVAATAAHAVPSSPSRTGVPLLSPTRPPLAPTVSFSAGGTPESPPLPAALMEHFSPRRASPSTVVTLRTPKRSFSGAACGKVANSAQEESDGDDATGPVLSRTGSGFAHAEAAGETNAHTSTGCSASRRVVLDPAPLDLPAAPATRTNTSPRPIRQGSTVQQAPHRPTRHVTGALGAQARVHARQRSQSDGIGACAPREGAWQQAAPTAADVADWELSDDDEEVPVEFGAGYFDHSAAKAAGADAEARFLAKRGQVAVAAAQAAGLDFAVVGDSHGPAFLASHTCGQCSHTFAPAVSGFKRYCSADCASTAALMRGQAEVLSEVLAAEEQ